MNFNERASTNAAKSGFSTEAEAELAEALGNFRSCVHSWSDAEFARPRAIAFAGHGHWRSVAAWALGSVLAVGSLSAGIYGHQHHDRLARIAAGRQAAAERLARQELVARQTAEQDEKLMAAVDQDVSQEVPSAMEPLAQLMDGSSK